MGRLGRRHLLVRIAHLHLMFLVHRGWQMGVSRAMPIGLLAVLGATSLAACSEEPPTPSDAPASTATATATLTPVPTESPTPVPTATPTNTPEPTAISTATPVPTPVAELSPAEVYELVSPSVAFIETTGATGSGVLIHGGYHCHELPRCMAL